MKRNMISKLRGTFKTTVAIQKEIIDVDPMILMRLNEQLKEEKRIENKRGKFIKYDIDVDDTLVPVFENIVS